MIDQLRHGKIKYVSFILLDIVCLVTANQASYWFYTVSISKTRYSFSTHSIVLSIMIIIDLAVSLGLNTLNRVQRRRKRKEILIGAVHAVISFVALTSVLFIIKQGADYSRVTVSLAYGIYFILFVGSHIVWKHFLRIISKKSKYNTAILMTSGRFAVEGINELKNSGSNIIAICLMDKMIEEIEGIPVVSDLEEAISIMCWDWIDKVYIYGIDRQIIPAKLNRVCWEMGIPISNIDFEYKIMELKTIKDEDPQYGALSFLEGKRDIPFPIRRVYWITETEADMHRGFHAHKSNCQLLFCPKGKIDIILDNGKEKITITLEGPEKGLLLMPGMWREMIWKETGSVLCVLASEYYDPDEYIRNYDEFISYRKESIDSQVVYG